MWIFGVEILFISRLIGAACAPFALFEESAYSIYNYGVKHMDDLNILTCYLRELGVKPRSDFWTNNMFFVDGCRFHYNVKGTNFVVWTGRFMRRICFEVDLNHPNSLEQLAKWIDKLRRSDKFRACPKWV